jgi:hypothetical protein
MVSKTTARARPARTTVMVGASLPTTSTTETDNPCRPTIHEVMGEFP